jgi:putative ABC transport system permease protein
MAIRNALKRKLYSLISIIGLSLGLASVILVGIYIDDELSYESWIPDSQNIYQLMPTINSQRYNITPSDLGLWLRQDYPQLDEVSRVFKRPSQLSKENIHFNETIAWVDSNFFNLFELEVVAGNIQSALTEPNSLVITESVAEKYFQNEPALGQTLILGREFPMRITAVLHELPSNTHLNLTILASENTLNSPLYEQDSNPISGLFGTKLYAINTYIKAPSSVNVDDIEADLDFMLDRHLPVTDGLKNSEIYELEILPIESIHLAPQECSGLIKPDTI